MILGDATTKTVGTAVAASVMRLVCIQSIFSIATTSRGHMRLSLLVSLASPGGYFRRCLRFVHRVHVISTQVAVYTSIWKRQWGFGNAGIVRRSQTAVDESAECS